jgi:hypothetical protein
MPPNRDFLSVMQAKTFRLSAGLGQRQDHAGIEATAQSATPAHHQVLSPRENDHHRSAAHLATAGLGKPRVKGNDRHPPTSWWCANTSTNMPPRNPRNPRNRRYGAWIGDGAGSGSGCFTRCRWLKPARARPDSTSGSGCGILRT